MLEEKVLLQISEDKKLIKFLFVNSLTACRLIGLAYLVYLSAVMPVGLEMIIAGGFLAFSDKLDGFLARAWGVETEFGAQFDKIVDKIFTIVVYCILCAETPWVWSFVETLIFVFTLFFNAAEFLVFFLGTILAKLFGIKISARLAGKIKVTCEYAVAGIWGYFLYLDPAGHFFREYQLLLLLFIFVTFVLVLNSARVYWRDLKKSGKI